MNTKTKYDKKCPVEIFRIKNEKLAKELGKVCKAILGDGRRRKKENDLKEVSNTIHQDIEFFEHILELNISKGKTVDDAIVEYLEKDIRFLAESFFVQTFQ